MKEYQKPEIELLDFTAEPIALETVDPDLGLETSPSGDQDL